MSTVKLTRRKSLARDGVSADGFSLQIHFAAHSIEREAKQPTGGQMHSFGAGIPVSFPDQHLGLVGLRMCFSLDLNGNVCAYVEMHLPNAYRC